MCGNSRGKSLPESAGADEPSIVFIPSCCCHQGLGEVLFQNSVRGFSLAAESKDPEVGIAGKKQIVVGSRENSKLFVSPSFFSRPDPPKKEKLMRDSCASNSSAFLELFTAGKN